MGLFSRKPKATPPELPSNSQLVDDALDELGMVGLNGLNETINAAMLKHLDPTNLADNDDTGGHFNQEFNLGQTAGRLKSLYKREPWVGATGSLIARTLCTIPLKVRDPETLEILENHPLNDTLKAGNKLQDNTTMKMSGYIDLAVSGNFFQVLSDDRKEVIHVPVEMATIQINENFDHTDRKSMPIDSLEVSGSYGSGSGGTTKIPWKNVIHHKMPNPSNPFIGQSMYMAAARPILLDRHKNEFEMAFYLRGATHAGVIETTEDINKQRMERLMRTFEQTFTGKKNWWRTLFLPKGAKWVNSGLTMAEMQHLDGLKENRLTLLAVIGVSPAMVGLVQDVNRATSEVQEAQFYTNTIVPMAHMTAAGWNNSYLVKVEYKNQVEVFADLSGIDAIEGSIITKGEQARSVESYLTLNEIRTDVLGYPPLKETDPRGQMLVKEIRPQSIDPYSPTPVSDPEDVGPEEPKETQQVPVESGEHKHSHTAEVDDQGNGATISTQDGTEHTHEILAGEVQPGGEDEHTHPAIDLEAILEEQEQEKLLGNIRASAVSSQESAEDSKAKQFSQVNNTHTDLLLQQARWALKNDVDVQAHLHTLAADRLEAYMKDATPVLNSAMERGYSIASSGTKALNNGIAHIRKKAPVFTPVDEQALDIIKERTEDGQRRVLAERSITAFAGFDGTKAERVMLLIEQGLEQGKTQEQIAADLRQNFKETYKGASTTITRTEVLSAVSLGIDWHHQTLQQVFTEVNKRWFHSGNIDGRDAHKAFEKDGKGGVVPGNHLWNNPDTGAQLRFPRDPSAGAGDVINCGCTMVSVIPDSAASNAETIIGGE